MSINLAVRYSHPTATSASVRYARIDNTSSPVYTTVTPNPPVSPTTSAIVVATNVPNGQYAIELTPIYADLRTCTPEFIYTDACPGLISLSAYIDSGNVIVQFVADATIPKVRILINYPNGGNYAQNHVNTGGLVTVSIPIPSGQTGIFSIAGRSVCDESSAFYSPISNQVTVANTGGITPIAGSFKRANTTVNICNETSFTLYTNGAFAIGSVLYQDISLSTPLTGFTYVVNAGNNMIYTVDTLTGQVLADSTYACNVVITNLNLTDNYKINSVTGISGFSLPGAVPSSGIGHQYIGIRNPIIATPTVGVNVTANTGATGKLGLYRNDILLECLNVTGDGTYTFGAHSYAVADKLEIVADSGSC